MKLDKKILICYNAPVSVYSIYSGKQKSNSEIADDMSENGFANEINLIENSLKVFYREVRSLAIDNDLEKSIQNILIYDPDVIFNFVETIEGVSSLEAAIAGVFELLNIEYTGNTPRTLGNCLNKFLSKQILNSFNINTPKAFVYHPSSRLPQKKFNLNFPVITKLLKEDASIGISENSVVSNLTDLNKQLKFLSKTYNQEILVEEYIEGREFNVAVLGERTLPISEIKFSGLPKNLPKIVTYEGKWIANSTYYKHTVPSCPAKINIKQKKLLEEIALKAFKALDCRDYARVDIRLNKENIPYVIEVNPNPDISTESGFFRAASISGLNYSEMLFSISNFSMQREKIDTAVKAV